MATPKVHPNNPSVRNPMFAQQLFSAGSKPSAFLSAARRLRSNAKPIFDSEDPIAANHWAEMRRLGDLHAAGETVDWDGGMAKHPPPNFDGAYVLIGFALENLLKGLAVAKGLVRFTGQELPRALQTHDLLHLHQLAQPRAKIPDYLLDALTYMTEWRGRYSLPVSADKFWRTRPDGTPRSAGISWPDSHQQIFFYCDALAAELQALI